jgi:hypothetical protein
MTERRLTKSELARHIAADHPEHIYPGYDGLKKWTRDELERTHVECHTLATRRDYENGLRIHSTADGRDYIVTLEEAPYFHGRDKRAVRFYDTEYAGDDRFGPFGQRAGEYNLSTILETNAGLDMMFGQPYWKISGEAMSVVRDWLRSATQGAT